MSRQPASSASLSRQERRIAALADQDPLVFATSTAAEIARLTSTSEASVARAAKKLGFSGIKEMKSTYASRVGQSIGLDSVIESRLGSITAPSSEAGLTGAASTVLTSAANLLLTLNRMIDAASFAEAVEKVSKQTRVVTYGLGTGLHIARYLSLELERSGLESFALTGSGHTNADAVHRIKSDDAVLVIAPRVIFPDISSFLEVAVTVTPHVIVMSQDELPDRLSQPIVHLRLPGTASGAATESVCAWALSDALVAETVRQFPERALSTRSTIQTLREHFSNKS